MLQALHYALQPSEGQQPSGVVRQARVVTPCSPAWLRGVFKSTDKRWNLRRAPN